MSEGFGIWLVRGIADSVLDYLRWRGKNPPSLEEPQGRSAGPALRLPTLKPTVFTDTIEIEYVNIEIESERSTPFPPSMYASKLLTAKMRVQFAHLSTGGTRVWPLFELAGG